MGMSDLRGKPTWPGSSRTPNSEGLHPAKLCGDAHTPHTPQGTAHVRSEGLLLSSQEHWRRWHTDKQTTAEIYETGSPGQIQRHRSQA